MCDAFERKENDFWGFKKNNIYTHDTAIKNGQAHNRSLKIKIYMINSRNTLLN